MIKYITHRDQVDVSKMTDQIKNYLIIKNKYPHSIVFYRVGDFWECFFEDASVASDQLELVLTYKRVPGIDDLIVMSGIPYHTISSYSERLLFKGYSVIVADHSRVHKTLIELNARTKKSTYEKLLSLRLLTFMG